MHAGQLLVETSMVVRMVERQFPQWRGLTVQALHTAATVNAVFRIGPDLAARLPLAEEPDAVRARLAAEMDAAREFARVSTVPVPTPVALADPDPDSGYPMPWTVHTWLPGEDATVQDPAASTAFATDLAALLAALRSAPTHGRGFTGTGRGGLLTDQDEWLERCFGESDGLLDVPRLRALWTYLRILPRTDPDVMCHGDLTPPNLLVRGPNLVGVLDAGGFAPADPALDLVSAWHLLDEQPRELLRRETGCDDVQWQRGMAWAFAQAMGLVWYYADSNPVMSRRTLQRIVDASG